MSLGLLSLPFLGKIRMILFALSTANLAIKSCSWLARTEVLLIITTIILVNESTTVTNLAIRSCNWLTRKDGGSAATPPCGMVISSLKAMVMIVVLISGPAIFENIPVSSPTCISGNENQAFELLWPRFARDTATKKLSALLLL